MHDGCLNPVWPCAMTGAVACLSGFSDLGVILHGSSGCYYYTESLVNAPIHCTFLIEEDIIFGTEERLREVVKELSTLYSRIAVVTMCVPSVTGEDIKHFLRDLDVLVVDTPGFTGTMEMGYQRALELLNFRVDGQREGINIDGICSVDRFGPGNRMEAARLLGKAGLCVATTFCNDTLNNAYHAAPVTIGTNPDFSCGIGKSAGSIIGIRHLRDTFTTLESLCRGSEMGEVMDEIDETEERIVQACDRHLRRFDPPRVALFSTAGYAQAIADMLDTYLDADIAVIGARNEPGESYLPVIHTIDLEKIRELIEVNKPDLIIGSSYEHAISPTSAFVGLTHPIRGRMMLHHKPVAGTEGALYIMESVLNACMDKKLKNP